jgi:cyclophilin family peptidyl-prolyl cis-trans isomerase
VRRSTTTLLALAASALSACGAGDGAPPPPPAASTQTSAAQPPSANGCRQAARPAPREEGRLSKPSGRLASGKSYEATVETNCGDFSFSLDTKDAPNASASFASLAEKGFFEGTVFHRIVPGFVIQGGDPTGTGSGGPGYKTRDKPPSDASYDRGVVAMAKAGNESAGTAGSQFFVVTGDDTGLTADYAVLGKVTKGLDVVDRIGKLGDASEQPTQVVVIQKVSVKGS